MARDLKNKVVVITGGADGIGLEIADHFLTNDAKVVIILDINEEQGFKAVEVLTDKFGEKKADFTKCDVTKDLQIVSKVILNKYKNIDVLVNSAGIANEFEMKKTIEINVIALMELSMIFWEHMRTDKGGVGGTIINIASIYGFRVDPFIPFYNASKFAVMGFTKSLGHEYNFNRFGVRVVAICPGFTETRLAAENKVPDAQTQADFTAFNDAAPWQKPDAVGRAAVEILEKADSGTAWLIEGDRPVEKVS